MSTYDFSTLYTTLPHHVIKDKLIDLTEHMFSREKALYLACNDQRAFFTSDVHKIIIYGLCQKVCEALVYLFDNIFIRFGTKLYRQIIGISMGTNCATLVADLFLFCYERDFMKSLPPENQIDIIEAFNIGIKHDFPFINIRKVPREMLKTSGEVSRGTLRMLMNDKNHV